MAPGQSIFHFQQVIPNTSPAVAQLVMAISMSV